MLKMILNHLKQIKEGGGYCWDVNSRQQVVRMRSVEQHARGLMYTIELCKQYCQIQLVHNPITSTNPSDCFLTEKTAYDS